MREFYELINEYPGTTFLVAWFIFIVLGMIFHTIINRRKQ